MNYAWTHVSEPSDQELSEFQHGLPRNVFRVRMAGRYACFTRPEYKAERRSYDTITPSAAVGFLESVYWHPGVVYEVRRIYVEKPVRFMSLTMNEVERPSGMMPQDPVAGRIQRTTTLLRDVSYVLEVKVTGEDNNKVFNMVTRRLANGQNRHTPYLGCREYVGKYGMVSPREEIKTISETRDLGQMFHYRKWSDRTHPGTRRSTHIEKLFFFHAVMKNGVIEVPEFPR
jgi:CRISPR-associated protein Cas5d